MLEWYWKRRQKRNQEVLKLYILGLANRISNVPNIRFGRQELEQALYMLDLQCVGKYIDLYLTEDGRVRYKFILDGIHGRVFLIIIIVIVSLVGFEVSPVSGIILAILSGSTTIISDRLMINHTFSSTCPDCYRLIVIKYITEEWRKRLDYISRGVRRMN